MDGMRRHGGREDVGWKYVRVLNVGDTGLYD